MGVDCEATALLGHRLSAKVFTVPKGCGHVFPAKAKFCPECGEERQTGERPMDFNEIEEVFVRHDLPDPMETNVRKVHDQVIVFGDQGTDAYCEHFYVGVLLSGFTAPDELTKTLSGLKARLDALLSVVAEERGLRLADLVSDDTFGLHVWSYWS